MNNIIQNEKDGSFTALMRGVYIDTRRFLFLVMTTFVINLFSLAVPLFTLQVYDRILSFQSYGTLNVLAVGVIVVVVLDVILKTCRNHIIGWASATFENAAYNFTLNHLLNLRHNKTKSVSPSEQLNQIDNIARLKSFYSGHALVNIIDLPFVLVFLGFIAYFSVTLFLISVLLLTFFAIYALFIGVKIKKTLQNKDLNDDERISFTTEILNNIHTVKMLGLENAFHRQHEHLQSENILTSYNLSEENAHSYNVASLFTQTMMVAMVSIGALLVLDGDLTMGVLIACVLLSGRVMQPIQKALTFWVSYQEHKIAKDKLEALLSLPVRQYNPIDEDHLAKGKLHLKAVNYSEIDGGQPLLKDINLRLSPGSAIALVGTPSKEKTTFMHLILGLISPDEGSVQVDNIEAATIPPSDIAKYVGYLSADTEIFQGTIMDNITSFRPNLETQAIEMSKYLGIDKVVSKLANGYQTMLFDGQADPITPGMKQRITIARILINRPRIVLFDFADRSLDKEGYNHVFKLLGQIKGQATLVLASNDKNIIQLADQEYSFEDGSLLAVRKKRVK